MESALSIQGLSKSFDVTEVLKDINIEVSKGDFLVLLGPSGCGKSTLLNIVAGLEEATGGEVLINGNRVNDTHPKDRNIAMVFQSYALYPTMSVRRNIGFGLEMRKAPKLEMDTAVAKAAASLQIEHLLDRKPGQLSGGQRQRVAMGRAIVRDPALFLFDEPLSNLDAKLRVEMRTEIKRIHERLKTTIIYVTHDQVEAMTLGTHVAVMKNGLVQQLDSPRAVYDRPANMFVAEFLGSPAMNFINGSIVHQEGEKFFVPANRDDGLLKIHTGVQGAQLLPSRPIVLGVRPEDFILGSVGLKSAVEVVEPTGPDTMLITRMGQLTLTVRVEASSTINVGETLKLGVKPGRMHFFDPNTTQRVA